MQTNLFFNIAAMSVMSFSYAYFIVQYESKTHTGKCFKLLMISVFAAAALDSVAVHLNETGIGVPRAVVEFIYCIYLIAVVLCAFSMVLYTRALIRKDGKRLPIDYFNNILMAVHVFMCVASPFVNIYFINTPDGHFESGPFYIVLYAFSGYYLVYVFVSMMKKYSGSSRRRFFSVIAFTVITFTGAMCQYYFFDSMVIYFIYAISVLILLFAFETPDYQKLVKTTEELEESRNLLEKARAREEELSRTVNELTRTATWVIYFGEDGGFGESKWSPEFFRMMGYADGEFKGEPSVLWVDSLHPDDREASLAAFMAGIQGQQYRIECRLGDKNGNYRWYRCSGGLKKDEEGHLLSYQGIIQDIDDEKYKNQLIEERLNAISELEQSRAELRRALLRAEEASSAKTRFLSNMSHDIRTPMNAIVGFTNLALEHVDDVNEVTECLNTIKSSGDHLLSLINDVLDMSRIESGKVTIEPIPCSIKKIIKDLGDMTYANAAEKNQKYIADCSGIIHDNVKCDRLRVNQILINCVGNAVKYTQTGGTIIVTASEKPADSDGIGEYEFRVKDNGMGMSPEFVKRVFEPFERAKSTTYSKIQGTGLGMAITKNLVDTMKGSIRVESEEGKGSEFIITLPFEILSDEDAMAAAQDLDPVKNLPLEEKLAALKGKHFLVVDDNRLNRRIVKRILGEKGMIIDECESGQEAIETVRNMPAGGFDMIFMDIQMPGMNGYETTDIIRNIDNPALKNIPILAMTANAFEEDKKMALEHGMNGHVAKPFKLEELADVLYRTLIME